MGRRELIWALALAGLLLPGADAPAVPQQGKGKAPAKIPGWLPDIPSGIRMAQKTGRPLMIVFR